MNKIKARQGIMSIAPYAPGKSIDEVQKDLGLAEVVKLAFNENPLKSSPKAIEAMRSELERAYMYPDGGSRDLRIALAAKYGLEASQIVVGNGGDHVISLITEAFVNEGDEVIVADPSFVTYKFATVIIGGRLISVPVKKDTLTLDLEAMAAAITERTKIIFLCNPNNPTATIVRRPEVDAFLAQVPERCLVVFDEAYFEYVGDPQYPDGLDYVRQERNTIVIRTFSKVYGLAGLRIGYAAGPKPVMDILARVLPPFPANRLAQAGALAALEDSDFISEVLNENKEGRAYLCAEFDKLGLTYAESHANYIFVDMKRDAAALNADLLKCGFILRPAGSWGYPTFFRISIGTMNENKKFINALRELTC